jgi:signal transduction histidine kinase/ActR/RegA family two-component response regulator
MGQLSFKTRASCKNFKDEVERADSCRRLCVSGPARPQLGRLVVTPFATIGVLAAVLTWEVEHVGSILLAAAIAVGGIVIGVVVSRQLRHDLARITDHYAALLRNADEQSRNAEAANRIKDEFLATLSHELRTPLNSVLGWARLLAGGKLDATQTARAVRAIERAGWAQSRLIEDLLDLSRMVAGTIELSIQPTALAPLVASAVESLRFASEAKRLTIETTIDPILPPIALDADRVKQVVWNLLSNAIKFTPGGGSVEIRVVAESGDVRITVSDTGVGFPPQVAAHLFERFRQGDASSTREHGGLGLGLGIVRHIVELHGGSVFASSGGENAGSTFEVRLPMRLITEAAAGPAPQPAAAPSLRGVSVLVVDDDPQQLAFVRDTLEPQGAVVVTASTPNEAMARFKRHPPDVLLSDLVLAGEGGFALIRDIRQLDQQSGGATPAGALTALARTEDRRRALSAGFQVHVAKPAAPSEIVKTVEWLARERIHRPRPH